MRLTVSLKMIIGFGAILLLMATSTLVLNRALSTIENNANEIVEKNIPMAEIAASMKLAAVQVQQWLTDVSATHNRDGYKNAAAAGNIFRSGLAKFREQADQNHDQAMRNTLNQLEKSFSELETTGKRMAETYIELGVDAGNIIMEDFDAKTENLAKAIDPLHNEQFSNARATTQNVVAELRSSSTLQLSILGVSLLIGIMSALLISRSILNQLGAEPKTVAEMASAIAEGDLILKRWNGTATRNGVFGAMFNMAEKLKSSFDEVTIRTQEAESQKMEALRFREEAETARRQAEEARKEGLSHAADSMESLVQELMIASQSLGAQVVQVSNGANIQRSRNEETASAMQEMNATSLEVAKNASEASENADRARKLAESGSRIVSDVVASIDHVKTQTDEMKNSLAELGNHAEGISKIMDVISDIADQTNLLALNAAIEAARAGDAGRGFAVVADEVRKLAEKTMLATAEVGKAIHTIQGSSRANITLMDEASSSVAQSTNLAENAGNALGKIVSTVESSSDQIRAIATASEEQTASSNEINRAIEDINRISFETAEGMSSAKDNLKTLAELTQNIHLTIERIRDSSNA